MFNAPCVCVCAQPVCTSQPNALPSVRHLLARESGERLVCQHSTSPPAKRHTSWSHQPHVIVVVWKRLSVGLTSSAGTDNNICLSTSVEHFKMSDIWRSGVFDWGGYGLARGEAPGLEFSSACAVIAVSRWCMFWKYSVCGATLDVKPFF